jgi:hypothetical protein
MSTQGEERPDDIVAYRTLMYLSPTRRRRSREDRLQLARERVERGDCAVKQAAHAEGEGEVQHDADSESGGDFASSPLPVTRIFVAVALNGRSPRREVAAERDEEEGADGLEARKMRKKFPSSPRM